MKPFVSAIPLLSLFTHTPSFALPNVRDIVASYKFSVALQADGTVLAWGDNTYGQLGNGTEIPTDTPTPVTALADVTAIATGFGNTLALRKDGTVWAWGNNESGQLGIGSTVNVKTPTKVQGLGVVQSIAAGYAHSFALLEDGTVWAWGDNAKGQLGDGTATQRNKPVQVQKLSGVASMSAGHRYSLALKTDGTVWAWGDNTYGQLGNGTTASQRLPLPVPVLEDVRAISAGYEHATALKNDGTLWSWGYNVYGQLGDGSVTRRYVPIQVTSLEDVAAISAGYYHSLAIRDDGTVWAWGYNKYGQLGDGTTQSRNRPVQVAGLSGIDRVTAGYFHSLAVQQDGTVWGWGRNANAELSDGTRETRLKPVRVDVGSSSTTTYSLTTQKTGNGSGVVSGDGYYEAGSTVTLGATANANSVFAGWSPKPCASTFTMPSSALTCTAAFEPATTTTVQQLEFRAHSTELPSSDQKPVLLTATAKNSKGVLLSGVKIDFSVEEGSDGVLRIIRDTTDAKGTAVAELTAGTNKRNRTIRVHAKSEDGLLDQAVSINVVGSTLEFNGTTSDLQMYTVATLAFALKDASGQPIPYQAITISSLKNGLSETTAAPATLGSSIVVTTDSVGLARAYIRINSAGEDTIDAKWDGSMSYAVRKNLPVHFTPSKDKLLVRAFLAGATGNPLRIPLDTPTTLKVTWKKAQGGKDVPVSGQQIRWVTDKGAFLSSSSSVATCKTNKDGQCTVQLASTVPGIATVRATGTSDRGAVSASTSVEFYARTQTKIQVQASPATIGVNLYGSTEEQSTIVATLRDSQDNPIAEKEVFFAIVKDSSGGTLSAASAWTNANGEASVVYTAGPSPTGANQVHIVATTEGPNGTMTDTAFITVAQKSVSVKLGTGNTVLEPEDGTRYVLPYNVLVSDIIGRPMPSVPVAVQVTPLAYRKGQYQWDSTQGVWLPLDTVTCPNEDINGNGLLDLGEDTNKNGRLDPGNVVTLSPSELLTEDGGFAYFTLSYAQQYASWVTADVVARAAVNGSEDEEHAAFTLPASAADLYNDKAAPPGEKSPFGILPQCAISVEKESTLRLVADRRAQIVVPLAATGSTLFGPGAQATGKVKVRVQVDGLVASHLEGTPVFAKAGRTTNPALQFSLDTQQKTMGDVAEFDISVTNQDAAVNVPVSTGGTSVGAVTFSTGSAYVTVAIDLIAK